MEILIIPDQNKKKAVEFAAKVSTWLQEYGVSSTTRKPDVAILLGGDGFTMRKSLELARHDLPFMAINFGTKGFLAVAEKSNWQQMLKKVIDGKYVVERRMILAATRFGKKETKQFEAAGNIYLRHRASMILLTIKIDGQTVYRKLPADGVIVATPTGSTAYNLGAGGPIISSGMIVTPICPHAMNVTSLPISETKKIEIVYLGRKSNYGEDEGCLLFVDSAKYLIEPGDRVLVKKSQKKASLIIPEGFSFFESLQKKLGLST